MNVILDGNLILDREMLHDVLAEELHLPVWYGRILDALYDCLTVMAIALCGFWRM